MTISCAAFVMPDPNKFAVTPMPLVNVVQESIFL